MSSKHHSIVILPNTDRKHVVVQAVPANVLTRPQFGVWDSSSSGEKKKNKTIHPNGLLCLSGTLMTPSTDTKVCLLAEIWFLNWGLKPQPAVISCRVRILGSTNIWKCNPFKPKAKKKPINLLSYTLFQNSGRETKINVSDKGLLTRPLWGRSGNKKSKTKQKDILLLKY